MHVQNPNCHSFDYIHDFDKSTESSAHMIGQIHTLARHHGTDVNFLSQKWGIGIEKARTALKHTTQRNIRSALLPLTWRYRADLLSQRLRRLNTKFYTDTLFTKVSTSLRGNTCAQIFTDGEGAIFAYPMWNKAEAREQLIKLCQQVGIPNELHRDGALEMRG